MGLEWIQIIIIVVLSMVFLILLTILVFRGIQHLTSASKKEMNSSQNEKLQKEVETLTYLQKTMIQELEKISKQICAIEKMLQEVE
jgi:predicted PurR-regulated permease PerM